MRAFMSRKLFLCVASFLLFVPASHAQKRAFTIEDFYRVKRIDSMHLSPRWPAVVIALLTDDLGKQDAPDTSG